MQTIKSILSNVHTWVIAAIVLSSALTALTKFVSPDANLIISAILVLCTGFINSHQVAAASAAK